MSEMLEGILITRERERERQVEAVFPPFGVSLEKQTFTQV